ncbi:MAG: GDSL-type esterase/lipase family protein [Oscillospiraceae bacterium]
MEKWITTFSIAQTDVKLFPFNNGTRTMRVFIPNNILGSKIKVKFKNSYTPYPVWVKNASVARCNKKDSVLAETFLPLTVNGNSSFAIVPESEVWSDEITLPVKQGEWLAISLYYPEEKKVNDGNFIANFTRRSFKGDFTFAEEMSCPALLTKLSHTIMPWDATSAVSSICEVRVLAEEAENKKVVAVFGDSICQQGTWTTPFTAKMYEAYPNDVSVCNLGIGGNRLLHESPAKMLGAFGEQGMTRYVNDILPISGLTHVIFALGTNDIGLPSSPIEGAPETDLITCEEYEQAVTSLVTELKKLDVKVFGATILPRALIKPFDEAREKLRLEMNEFIKTSGVFDEVLDFATVVQREDGVGMRPEYDQPDGLHPNLVGGKVISDSIDVSLFK